jgi:hypothetical protein
MGRNTATLEFIRRHADDDVRQLALRGTKDADVDLPFALDQIAGRQTARRKLPTWAATEGIVYPPHLSMEQCSSETTARYKAQLISNLLNTTNYLRPFGSEQKATGTRPKDGNPEVERQLQTSFIDLTGGLGVDFSFLARVFDQAVYVEQQTDLCDAARHNMRLLGLEKAEIVCADGTDYLRQTTRHYTLIYIDPARRDVHGGRTFAISDCTPDVLTLLDELMAKSDVLLLKLSPMLDWRKAISDIGEQWVREVHIVSVGNECKELLLLLFPGEGLRVVCVNDCQVFESNGANGTEPHEPYEPYGPHGPFPRFLYEPNASIMKAGCFDEVAERFSVSQIAPNSHLFLADRLVADFPGRAFEVLAVTTMNKHELKEKLLGIEKANIAVRNFPLSVAELRRRLKISEGGSTYIFATTLKGKRHALLICSKA